ncbi:MAG: hypothetical protein ACRDY1_10125 [Acidimicrobiales bacterium]
MSVGIPFDTERNNAKAQPATTRPAAPTLLRKGQRIQTASGKLAGDTMRVRTAEGKRNLAPASAVDGTPAAIKT